MDPMAGWIVGSLAGAGGVIALLFKLLMGAKDQTIADLKAENLDLKSKQKSWEEIAEEGRKSAIETANFYREKYEGKPPIIPLAPVVSESHSPSTAKQREEARIATARAAMAQIKLACRQEPRPEPEQAVEPNGKKGMT